MTAPDLLAAYHRLLDAELRAVASGESFVSADQVMDWLDELERLDERLDAQLDERADDAAA